MTQNAPGDTGPASQRTGSAPAFDGMYARIVQVAADAIVTVDEAQRIVHFNHGAEVIFGYSADEVLGRSLGVLLPIRVRAAHAGYVTTFGQSAETARLMGHRREVFGRRKDGVEFPAEASILKLDAPDGRRLYTAVVRDVTDRKRLDQQQRFLSEVSAALSGSLDLDATLQSVVRLPVPSLADACVLDVREDSGSFRRLTFGAGDSPELALLGSRFAPTPDSVCAQLRVLRTERSEIVQDVTDAWLRAHCDSAAEAAVLRALQVRSMLIVPLLARADAIGVVTFLSLHHERRNEPGDVIQAENFASRAALAIDNARLYRDAQRATRAREHVLGVVSHDLRNPLSAIAMCARVLAETPPADGSARAELARAIVESTSWMSRMIQDLLDVAAIDAGVLSVVRERTALEPIVTRAIDLFAGQAHARGVALERAGSVDPAILLADSERITQAIANLLGNAMKYTPEGGRVTVSTTAIGDGVAVEVEDTGCGIAADDLTHIFDRYWHSRHANAGSGLGLAIAKGIVEAHDGRIAVSSTPGVGSRFTLVLPRAAGIER